MNEKPGATPAPSQSRGPLFYAGSAALLIAMAVDAMAVLGRHSGFSLLGSIEVVQATMLLASSAALVAASVADRHATVHLLVDRVGPRARRGLVRLSALFTAVFFLALAVGSAWIAVELRAAHEASELLHIPYAPLRLVSIGAMLGLAGIAVLRILRRCE